MKKKKITPAMEDYLEAIYELKKETGMARVGKISVAIGVKSPTVNSALKKLSAMGLVLHAKYGHISLTAEGERVASMVKNKHNILFRFLTEFLMIDPAAAQEEACAIEHSISEKTYVRFTKFFKFLEQSMRPGKPRILALFEKYLKTGKRKPCKYELEREKG